MASSQDENERSRILLAFAAISAIFVILIMVVLAGALLASRFLSPTQAVSSSPYGLAARSLPATSKLFELLPEKLGALKRTALSGSVSNFGATYSDGKTTITIQGSQAVSVRAAQATVALTAQSMGNATSERFNADPSYMLQVNANSVSRLVWSHDRWYFDVSAPSKAALDAFMQEFKY